jgi:hypothetical protein
MSKTEPAIKFSNEESKTNIKNKIEQNLINLIDLTKSVIKSSETHELFKNCFKNFTANEAVLEQSCDKLKKIEIISNQLNYQVTAIQSDCDLVQEVCKQIDSIQKKNNHYTNK